MICQQINIDLPFPKFILLTWFTQKHLKRRERDLGRGKNDPLYDFLKV